MRGSTVLQLLPLPMACFKITWSKGTHLPKYSAKSLTVIFQHSATINELQGIRIETQVEEHM